MVRLKTFFSWQDITGQPVLRKIGSLSYVIKNSDGKVSYEIYSLDRSIIFLTSNMLPFQFCMFAKIEKN